MWFHAHSRHKSSYLLERGPEETKTICKEALWSHWGVQKKLECSEARILFSSCSWMARQYECTYSIKLYPTYYTYGSWIQYVHCEYHKALYQHQANDLWKDRLDSPEGMAFAIDYYFPKVETAMADVDNELKEFRDKCKLKLSFFNAKC